MKDRSYCNCCVNRDSDKCENCYQVDSRSWSKHVNFLPKAPFAKYFHRGWISMKEQEYMWNSTRCDRPITRSVLIHNKHYCPYCANKMFPIQDSDTLCVIGHTCFCDGAQAELEYEAAKEQLLKKHEHELAELRDIYNPRLTSDLHTLFNIKQEEDKLSFEFFHKGSTCLGFTETKTIDLEELI